MLYKCLDSRSQGIIFLIFTWCNLRLFVFDYAFSLYTSFVLFLSSFPWCTTASDALQSRAVATRELHLSGAKFCLQVKMPFEQLLWLSCKLKMIINTLKWINKLKYRLYIMLRELLISLGSRWRRLFLILQNVLSNHIYIDYLNLLPVLARQEKTFYSNFYIKNL